MSNFPYVDPANGREVSRLERLPYAPIIENLPKFLVGEMVRLKPEYLFPNRGPFTALPSVKFTRERPDMKVVRYNQAEKAVFCELHNEAGEQYIEPFDEDTLIFISSAPAS